MQRWSVLILGYFALFGCVFGIPADVPCFNDTWVYSSVSGKCYKLVGKDKPLTWSDASLSCQQSLAGQSTVQVHLARFNNEVELNTLVETLLQIGSMEAIWIGAYREPTQIEFLWKTDKEIARFPYLDWDGGQGVGNCLRLSYLTDIKPSSSNWKTYITLQNVDCSEKYQYICEHEVAPCTNPPGGFNETTMTFSPSMPVPRSVVKAVCKDGSFMSSTTNTVKVPGPNLNDTLKANEYYCTGRRATSLTGDDADPALYQGSFQYSGFAVSECLQLRCPLYVELLEHVDVVPTTPFGSTFQTYEYGSVVELNCSYGYVSQENALSTQARMRCSQSDPYSSEGIWIPEFHEVCQAVKCDDQELKAMVPKNGFLSSARNPLTDRIYTQNQVNEFNQYGNIITIRCNPGYLFPDRTVEKMVTCDMSPGMRNQGVYNGYLGTILPIPSTCEETTCMYETAVIKAEYQMQPYFLVKNGTTDWVNLTKHEGKPYALGAQIRYFCNEGYETVNQNLDFNITCSDTGLWNPQLIGCITKTAKLPSSSSGRFQTEPEESKSAKQISSVVFILIFIFIGFIILLDLTTIGRDAKHLWSNLKLQKKRLAHKRRGKSHGQDLSDTSNNSYLPSGEDTFSNVRNRNG